VAERPKSPRFAGSFINSHVKRGYGVRQIDAGLAYKIFAIAVRRRSCSSGIKLAQMSSVVFRQTGLRLSEVTSLDRQALTLGTGAHVQCHGKGRKTRCTPLTKQTAAALRAWLKEPVRGTTNALFPNVHGGRLSSDAVQYLLAKYVAIAQQRSPTLKEKRVTFHSLRHSSAMELLAAGVDTSVIALWLGHENVETTQIYLHAHLTLKEAALAKTRPLTGKHARFRPGDELLEFLQGL
jgi:site-specific recombinase XerD